MSIQTLTDGSADTLADITKPIRISARERARQRCADLRTQAQPILADLLFYRFPGGWESDGTKDSLGYYYLADENPDSKLGTDFYFKISLESGFVFLSKDGKNFAPARTLTGKNLDIVDFWQNLNGVETVAQACDKLKADIAYVLRESPEARDERRLKGKTLG